MSQGLIVLWKYHRDYFTEYGWFQSSTKYVLEMKEKTYCFVDKLEVQNPNEDLTKQSAKHQGFEYK